MRVACKSITTRSGCGTGKRGNSRRVIVRFHLHQDMNGFVTVLVLASGSVWYQSRLLPALDNSGIVRICRDDAVGRRSRRALDHAEQLLVLRLAVDDPVSIENFVSAVFRVCLRKHH